MKDLQKRSEFWSEKHTIPFQGNSKEFPLSVVPNYQQYVENKIVMEIGPGEGRQLDKIKPLTSSYVIADISQSVLDKHSSIPGFLITNYSEDFGIRVDTIVLFYVFHHVMVEEVDSFILFLKRHLNSDGHLCFNIPTNHSGDGDGITTTNYNPKDFIQKLLDNNLDVLYNESLDQVKNTNNFMIVAKNK